MIAISPEKKSVLFPLELKDFVSQSLSAVGDASKGLDLATCVILFHKSLSSHGNKFLCL